MNYAQHFQHADDVIEHLTPLVAAERNPLLEARYTGFLTVAAVTTYELAIKNIFISFAQSKHKVPGSFTESHFNRINGKIKLRIVKDDYVLRFGKQYLDRFNRKLDECGRKYYIDNKLDIVSSYGNLVVWRNDFAHEGRIRANSTFLETAHAYTAGKEVIRCLAESMRR
ncbi:HEPN domain-containing protein [Stenotrophomonas geniculata]|uniref:HEPN domain-containing protein n=1 Tax=Stenotrophomonas TaxID=40323 RepID=UPI003D32FE9E